MMDMMEYRHKAMAYLGPLPAFSTLAGEEEIYGIGSEGALVKVCSKRLLEAVMGLNGEAGECQEIVKKAMFHGHELDIEALLLEAGDVLWYLTELCNELGISVDTIAKLNLQKLKNRYPDGFTHEASRERKE
jgi:NTP pyrophosphatase (non-canonical NTP hydrolase)|nr:MAG TPA: NTP-PPase-like protein [Caudoviricetes sp.]